MMQYLQSKNTHIWFDSALVSEPVESLFDVDYWQSQDAIIGSAQGRGTTWFIQMANIQAAMRHYRRGGLFGRIVKDHYLYTGLEKTRSFMELSILTKLIEEGVNVPRPIAARIETHGITYCADLLSEKVPNARDLVDVLTQRALSEQEYQRVGEQIARMHRAGVNHTDLNIHNILLDDAGKVWIIDFDKCFKQQGDDWKSSNIQRLLRSFRKELKKRSIQWQESDFKALISGYKQEQ